MKPLNKALSASLLAGALALGSAAHAAPVESDTVLRAIEDAGIGGDIDVTVDDEGVATLTGTVDAPSDGVQAVQAVRQVPGVSKVVHMMRWDD